MTPSTPVPSGPRREGRPRRPDESMTLLTEMMDRPLDPSYAAEVARREAAGLPATPAGRGWRMGLVMLLIGLMVGVFAMALRQPKEAVAQQKSALIAQIERRQREADATEARMAAWEAEIAAVRKRQLDESDQQALAARLSSAESAAAAVAVQGPGVVVSVDDAPAAAGGSADGDPRTGTGDPGRVQSGDLQSVVNGLWAAGAEAIDINGHRLTSTSAIRFAGEAILVDYRPLTRPYLIHAIGDPASLRARFEAGADGKALAQLGEQLGVRHSLTTSADLTLPADRATTLRHARAVAPAAPSSTAATRPDRPTPSPTTTEAHP